MTQKPIELILMRQVASYLALPVFIVDDAGTLVFYNEAAERIIGKRFEETGEMPATEWGTVFVPTDDRGVALEPNALPLSIALTQQRPAYATLWIHALDRVPRHIDSVAFPLLGQAGTCLGAVAIFWESQEA
ncbi:MAG TPA: PAS domain-containing protein [Candidatus Binatia bacterium]|nr:PAS domain-containing protein [Candidatus Binatia bacterium]